MAYTGSVPDTAARRRDWMARMACRDRDPNLFSDPDREHDARIICVVQCPVRAQCLAAVTALEAGATRANRDGVVAGLTGHERWRIDPKAYRCKTDPPLLDLTAPAPDCGTHAALVRHLGLGEDVDPECWSAEIRRDRLARVSHGVKQPKRAGPPRKKAS